ncbi:unnamed protein product [Lactuca virosa]|uniref:RING-type E3 ubiquitin transferase n=1 Tax=Lactuca virosa TaxID=75947 RepID=A0AAU9PBJ0_9ASTR|nr:unnamed protein product [Lactuca virosa]
MEIEPPVLATHDGVGNAPDSSSDYSASTVPINSNNISSNRCDDDNDEEEDVCRICRNSRDVGNPLRYLCACIGSIKFVHQDFLLQWLNHSNAR